MRKKAAAFLDAGVHRLMSVVTHTTTTIESRDKRSSGGKREGNAVSDRLVVVRVNNYVTHFICVITSHASPSFLSSLFLCHMHHEVHDYTTLTEETQFSRTEGQVDLGDN